MGSGKFRPRNGGRRPGAGRKPGATTIRTREIADRLTKDQGVTPLEVMVQTMRALWTKAERKDKGALDITFAERACEIAEKVAPYMHPRLASVEQFVDAKVRQFAVSDEPMEADEWDKAYGPLATSAGASKSAH